MLMGGGEENKEEENDEDIIMSIPRTLRPEAVLEKFMDYIRAGCPNVYPVSDRYLWNEELRAQLKRFYSSAQFVSAGVLRETTIERKTSLPMEDICINTAENAPYAKGLDGQRRLITSERTVAIFNHDTEREDLKTIWFVLLLCISNLMILFEEFEPEIHAAYLRFEKAKEKGGKITYKDVMLRHKVPYVEVRELRRILMGFGEVIWQNAATNSPIAALAKICSFWEPEITHWSDMKEWGYQNNAGEQVETRIQNIMEEIAAYSGPFVKGNIHNVKFTTHFFLFILF